MRDKSTTVRTSSRGTRLQPVLLLEPTERALTEFVIGMTRGRIRTTLKNSTIAVSFTFNAIQNSTEPKDVRCEQQDRRFQRYSGLRKSKCVLVMPDTSSGRLSQPRPYHCPSRYSSRPQTLSGSLPPTGEFLNRIRQWDYEIRIQAFHLIEPRDPWRIRVSEPDSYLLLNGIVTGHI